MTHTTSHTAPRSARDLARIRRRRSWARNWRLMRRHRGGMTGLTILALIVLVALTAPLFFPAESLDVTAATGQPLAPPNSEFWLGTDESGRSVLALLAWGSRISLVVGLAATLISMVIGTAIGIAAGYYSGFASGALNRLTDWFLVIPFLPLAIVLSRVVSETGSIAVTVLVIGLTSWPGTARLIRAQTLAVVGRPYLERARALGGSPGHLMSKHILPSVMPLVLANTTLTVAIAILSETTLSFLGLGDPTRPSWGTMLDGAFSNGAISAGAWWYIIPPGMAVVLVVLAFTLIGRALEEILDPRLQEAA